MSQITITQQTKFTIIFINGTTLSTNHSEIPHYIIYQWVFNFLDSINSAKNKSEASIEGKSSLFSLSRQ